MNPGRVLVVRWGMGTVLPGPNAVATWTVRYPKGSAMRGVHHEAEAFRNHAHSVDRRLAQWRTTDPGRPTRGTRTMTNKPGDIGTRGETGIVTALHTRGFPGAERRRLRGRNDPGDIIAAPGFIVQSKSGHYAEQATDDTIRAWLEQTEQQRINARADIALLVTKRKGIAPARAHLWWAHWRLTTLTTLAAFGQPRHTGLDHLPVRMTVDHALTILRHAGWGTPS